MSIIGGFFLFLIGIVSLISLLVYGYKEFKKDETKTSKKVLFLILGLLDIFFGTGSLEGLALLLSVGAILIGLLMLMGAFH